MFQIGLGEELKLRHSIIIFLFLSLLGSVSVFQFGLGEDLRLKLPAFGGKSNCKSSTALHVLIAVGGCIRGNGRFLRTNIDMTIVILKHCDQALQLISEMKVEDRPGELNGYIKPVLCYRVDMEDSAHRSTRYPKKKHEDQCELGIGQ